MGFGMGMGPCPDCGCGCIICTTDDFNRANGDVVTSAPIPWVPSGVFSIVSSELKFDSTGNEALQLNQVIDLGLTTAYKVTLEMVDWNNHDTIILMMSWESSSNWYAACYTEIDGTTAELAIYWVVGTTAWAAYGTPPADWILLNSTLITSLFQYPAPRAIECEISLADGLMEIRTLSEGVATSVDDACIAYYTFNFGAFVGVATGWMVGDANVDNFALCENQCQTGCIIFVDGFTRADSDDVADADHPWDESDEDAPGDMVIFEEKVHWLSGADTLWLDMPHPNGFWTMGVAARVQFNRACNGGPCSSLVFDTKFIIYVAVDQIPNPLKYVKVTYDSSLDTVRIDGVNNTGDVPVTTLLGSATGATFGPNTEYDLYVCVSHTGRVSAYAWNAASAGDGTLVPICTAYANSPENFLGGPYCGVGGEHKTGTSGGWNYETWTTMNEFVFLRTYHPGDPKIIRWTVGGTVEVGDKFTVEITKDGITESYTVTTTKTILNEVAQEIVETIAGLDPYLYYTLRSVRWYKDISTTGAFLMEAESDVDGNPSTTENGGGVADGQTFTVATIQEFVQGDSRCPRCPPPCEDCSLCTGYVAPQHDAPSVVIVHISGIADNGAVSNANCWEINNPTPVNLYGPPFPGVQNPAEDCTDDGALCREYNGTFILEGCNCAYVYASPTWFETYYPDPNPFGGPPGTYEDQDTDPSQTTCHPGVDCNGFVVQADIIDAGGGLRKWKVWYVDLAEMFAFYYSAAFPSDECKYSRTLTLDSATVATGVGANCTWPTTIQLSPVD